MKLNNNFMAGGVYPGQWSRRGLYGGFLVESYNYIAQLADYPWKFRGQLTNPNTLITYQFG